MCSIFSLKVANIVKLEAILFMLIRSSKRQNSAWEQGKSNPAYPNYAKKSGSQLLLRNASRMHISQKWLYVPRYLCSPVPMFPDFFTLIVDFSINR